MSGRSKNIAAAVWWPIRGGTVLGPSRPLVNPHAGGYFLEVKSRTWSRRDAQDKAAIITELLKLLGARPDETIEEGYVAL